MNKMIATWDMSFNGVSKAKEVLKNDTLTSALLKAIVDVENDSRFKSVGYGGLPNIDGEVQTDAAYMNGDNLKIGAIAGAKNIKNPILVAEHLSHLQYNNMLVGTGAEKYAQKNGFEMTNMLTKSSKEEYEKKLKEIDVNNLNSYDGHDTVCMLAKKADSIHSAVSTSGLFLKHEGRVGDSPISGSGFYADSLYGAAAATGLGEDLMKGCVSYDVITNIKNGLKAQDAAEKTLRDFEKNLIRKGEKPRAMSIIALDKEGNYGVATNVWFPFVIIEDDNVNIYLSNEVEGSTYIWSPSEDEIKKMSFNLPNEKL